MSNNIPESQYIISGADFNKIYDGIKFYKFLPNDLMFYNYQYELGLNSNVLSFDSTGKYVKGGLYFCDGSKCHLFWQSYGKKLAIVEIPNDAQVYVEKDKFKSDKLIITNIVNFFDVADDFWINILQHNGLAFEYIKDQSEEICKYAIQKNQWLLEYVQDQFLTEELCKLAVQENGIILQLVKNQTYDICNLAVQHNGMALKYVQDQFLTEELCKLAIKQDYRSLEYVKESSDISIDEICKFAVSKNGYALQYVKNQTDEICTLAVNENANALQYVKKNF